MVPGTKTTFFLLRGPTIPTRLRGPQIRAWHEIASFSDKKLVVRFCILAAFSGYRAINFVPGTKLTDKPTALRCGKDAQGLVRRTGAGAYPTAA